MRRLAALALGAGLLPAVAVAQQTQQDYHDQGKAFATTLNTNVSGIATNTGNTSLVPSYAGSSRPESSYVDGNMYDPAVAAAQDTSTPQGNAASLIQGSFASRPNIPVNKTDPWLQPGNNAIANAPSAFSSLTGQYADCTQSGGGTSTTTNLVTCDVYYTETNNTCSVGTDVTVIANWQYLCTETRNTYTQTCTRTLNATYDTIQGVVTSWVTTCP